MRLSFVACIALLGCLFTFQVHADRDTETREEATDVVVGYVRAVYARETEWNRHYVVEMVIEKVESTTTGLTAGKALHVVCYQPKPRTGRESEEELRERSLNVDGGHKQVPAEGDVVRAFIRQSNGTYDAIFPDWVDVVQAAESGAVSGGTSPSADVAGQVLDHWPRLVAALLVGLAVGYFAARRSSSPTANKAVDHSDTA